MTANLDLGVEYGADPLLHGATFASETFDEPENDDLEYDDEFASDDEFLPGLPGSIGSILPNVVSAGANAVRNLVNTASRTTRHRRVRPNNYGSHVQGVSSGSIMTARGPIRTKFDQSFVTATQLKNALTAVRRDIDQVGARIASTHGELDKQIKTVSQSAATGLAAEVQARNKAVKLARIEIDKKIDSTRVALEKRSNDNMMMSLMMSQLGGLGGSGGGTSQSNDTLLMFALMSGMSGNSSGSNDLMSNPLLLMALLN